MNKIVTIGVYGFTKEEFFNSLLAAHVDTFCDIRLRRGMRGSQYAFVNSLALQDTLQKLGIRYLHLKNLAPAQTIRDLQKQEDERLGQLKRARNTLGQAFINAYEQECLATFDTQNFLDTLGSEASIVSFFCVEREPAACHRSLVAQKLEKDLKITIENIMPPMVSL